MRIIARALAGMSGLLLLADAYLHSTGTADVRAALEGAQLSDFFGHALPIVWLFFSWHLAVVAVPMLWASLTNPSWFLPAAVFCGAVALGDFFWVYSAAGWFPGSLILAAVAVALAVVCISLLRSKGDSAA